MEFTFIIYYKNDSKATSWISDQVILEDINEKLYFVNFSKVLLSNIFSF